MSVFFKLRTIFKILQIFRIVCPPTPVLKMLIYEANILFSETVFQLPIINEEEFLC